MQNVMEFVSRMGFEDAFGLEGMIEPEQLELFKEHEEIFVKSLGNHLDNLFRILVDEEPATTVVRDCGDIVWARPDQVPMGVRMHEEVTAENSDLEEIEHFVIMETQEELEEFLEEQFGPSYIYVDRIKEG